MSLTKVSYSMIDGAVFNVLDFGASPSASAAQNQTAFEAAIAAASGGGSPGGVASGPQNSVYVPPGVYDIIGNLRVYGNGMKFYGAGIGATTINVTTSVPGIVCATLTGNPPSTAFFNHGNTTSDFRLVGGTYGIVLGGEPGDSFRTYVGTVDRIEVKESTQYAIRCAIAIASLNDLNLINNENGVLIENPTTHTTFKSVRIFNSTLVALRLSGGRNISFVGCDFENSGKQGVIIDNVNTVASISFLSCWFENNLRDLVTSNTAQFSVIQGPDTNRTENLTIQDCYFTDVRLPGNNRHIHFGSGLGRSVEKVFLANNTFIRPPVGQQEPIEFFSNNAKGTIINVAEEDIVNAENQTLTILDETGTYIRSSGFNFVSNSPSTNTATFGGNLGLLDRGLKITLTDDGQTSNEVVEINAQTPSPARAQLHFQTDSVNQLVIDQNGNSTFKLTGAAPTPSVTSTMVFELTSNTELKVFVRGTDGTVRSATLALS